MTLFVFVHRVSQRHQYETQMHPIVTRTTPKDTKNYTALHEYHSEGIGIRNNVVADAGRSKWTGVQLQVHV